MISLTPQEPHAPGRQHYCQLRCLLACTAAWHPQLLGWVCMSRLTKSGLHAEDAMATYRAADDKAAAAVLATLCSQEGGNASDLAAVAACEAASLL